MSNLDISTFEWLQELFKDEYCAECGGDAIHHTAIPFFGNWFARCKYPYDINGNQHPVISTYRRGINDEEEYDEEELNEEEIEEEQQRREDWQDYLEWQRTSH